MNKTLCTILAALALAGCPKKSDELVELEAPDACGNNRVYVIRNELVEEQRIHMQNGQTTIAKYHDEVTELSVDKNGDGVADIITVVPASEMPRPYLPWPFHMK